MKIHFYYTGFSIKKCWHAEKPNNNLNHRLYLPNHSNHGLDVTQGQFLSRVKLVRSQNFLSPTLVALPMLKKHSLPCYLTTAGESQGYLGNVKLIPTKQKQKSGFGRRGKLEANNFFELSNFSVEFLWCNC